MCGKIMRKVSPAAEILFVLNKNGLSVVEKYDFESFGAVRNNSEKIIYIAKKG